MQFIKKVFGETKYPNLPFRIFIALVAAIFICAQSNKRTFLEFLVMPQYYIALFCSVLIAMLLIEIIHWQNYLLDKYLKWRENPISRTAALVAFGWFVPIHVAWLAAYIYFDSQEYDIANTGYEQHLYPPIKAFIVLLNVYYNWDLFKKEQPQVQHAYVTASTGSEMIAIEEALDRSALSGAPEHESESPLKAQQEIALIYLESKNTIVLDKKNQLVSDWAYNTIQGSLAALSPDKYLLIGRDVIVCADMIEKIERNKHNIRELVLYLKSPLSRTYIVPKGRVSSMRRFGERNDVAWWDKKKKKFR